MTKPMTDERINNPMSYKQEDKLKEFERSLDRLDPVFDALAEKYGDEGAGIIMGTKMMIQVLLPGNLSVDEVVRLADKIALFNGVKPLCHTSK